MSVSTLLGLKIRVSHDEDWIAWLFTIGEKGGNNKNKKYNKTQAERNAWFERRGELEKTRT